jgi:glutathione S-transferase
LRIMENHLQDHRYFAADRYTIADIALYAHTHLAQMCDFDLAAFPAVRAWLDRIVEQPGHVLMDEQPAEAAQMQVPSVDPGQA